MKLTWFGRTAFRIHAGGRIVVVDAEAAPVGVDRRELLGGADDVVGFAAGLPMADGAAWRPRPAGRLLDAGETPPPPAFWSLGEGTVLVDADGEAPLLLVAGAVPPLGRWADRAAVILAGTALAERGETVLAAAAPRLLALAGSEAEVDAAFAALARRLDGTGLVALEPGLAVEA